MDRLDDAPDLFGMPALPGFACVPGFVAVEEEAALIALIDGDALAPFRFHQWTGKRQTRSYGWTYDFETGAFAKADPLPGWLDDLKERVASITGVPAPALEQVLLTRYDAGAGIGWHRDRSVFRDVIGVSLGAPSSMRFRRRSGTTFERRSMPLPPRGLYRLSGEARFAWEHSIAPMAAPRWSITFRSLARESKG